MKDELQEKIREIQKQALKEGRYAEASILMTLIASISDGSVLDLSQLTVIFSEQRIETIRKEMGN